MEKEALTESHQAFEVAAGQTFGLVNLVFSCQTVFFFKFKSIIYYSHSVIDKPMVITEPTVATARLLALGSNLNVHPRNMPPMVNKDLTEVTNV